MRLRLTKLASIIADIDLVASEVIESSPIAALTLDRISSRLQRRMALEEDFSPEEKAEAKKNHANQKPLADFSIAVFELKLLIDSIWDDQGKIKDDKIDSIAKREKVKELMTKYSNLLKAIPSIKNVIKIIAKADNEVNYTVPQLIANTEHGSSEKLLNVIYRAPQIFPFDLKRQQTDFDMFRSVLNNAHKALFRGKVGRKDIPEIFVLLNDIATGSTNVNAGIEDLPYKERQHHEQVRQNVHDYFIGNPPSPTPSNQHELQPHEWDRLIGPKKIPTAPAQNPANPKDEFNTKGKEWLAKAEEMIDPYISLFNLLGKIKQAGYYTGRGDKDPTRKIDQSEAMALGRKIIEYIDKMQDLLDKGVGKLYVRVGRELSSEKELYAFVQYDYLKKAKNLMKDVIRYGEFPVHSDALKNLYDAEKAVLKSIRNIKSSYNTIIQLEKTASKVRRNAADPVPADPASKPADAKPADAKPADQAKSKFKEQIDKAHMMDNVDPEMAKLITVSGDRRDDKVTVSSASWPATSLKPSQTTMVLDKALGMAIGMLKSGNIGGDLGAIVSSDGYIMDGHHRWAATILASGSNGKVNGFKANLKGPALLNVLNIISKGAFNVRSGNPGKGSISEFNPEKVKKAVQEAIVKGIGEGKFHTSPEEIKKILAKEFGSEEKGVDTISSNVKNMTLETPSWAPDRKQMPVIDPDNVSETSNMLNQGQVDIRPPYKHAGTNLDGLANALEAKGFFKEALEIDRLSDKMERDAEAPTEELIINDVLEDSQNQKIICDFIERSFKQEITKSFGEASDAGKQNKEFILDVPVKGISALIKKQLSKTRPADTEQVLDAAQVSLEKKDNLAMTPLENFIFKELLRRKFWDNAIQTSTEPDISLKSYTKANDIITIALKFKNFRVAVK